MDVTAPSSARALTRDGVEQTEPHVNGDRLVWADYRASDTGEYQPVDDPNLNNADIYGWDLAADEEALTQSPSTSSSGARQRFYPASPG